MNPLISILRRFSTTKAANDNYPGTWLPLTGGEGGVSAANLLEANREWVFVAVDKVASSLAGVRFKAMRYTRNGDDQEVFEGPLVSFLERPAPNLTGKDFIYLNTVYKELTGNAFWERLGKGQVQPLIPTKVSPILRDGQLAGFKYSEGTTVRTLLAKNVLHDRYADPAKPWWGASKLQKIDRWVDTSTFAVELLRRFFVNGATFGGFIETEEETEQRIRLIKAGLQNDHVGVENAHKIGVLPKGSKFAKATANMAEMEMGATDDRYRDKILAAFGVPKTLVGLTTEVNRASAEASEYIFAKYTVKPIADDLVEFLNTTVAPLLDSSGAQYFAYDEFVPENMELKLREREIALNKQPYMTVNEVRASVGLPRVEGGDVVYGAPTQVPLGTPAPAPTVPNTEEDEEPQKRLPAPLRAAFKRERIIDRMATKAADIMAEHHDPDAESHKSFVERVESREQGIADAVREFNRFQERGVMDRLHERSKALKSGDLMNMDGETSVMVDFVTPLLKGLLVEQAMAEFASVADYPLQFNETEPSIARTVESAARRLAKSYNKTTADLLLKTLNDGIEAGDGLNQLIERVRVVYDFSNTVRAAAVARTEAFYIANEGSREAYRQSGIVKSLRWYTAEDERVCPWCGPQNGRIVGVEEVFFEKGDVLTSEGKELKLDYRAIDVPPLHTNCRCFIRPERIEVG